MPKPTTENSFSFKTNKTKLTSIANRPVMTLISLGKGISGEKNIASEEKLHIEILKELNIHNPSSNTILVAGLLKRWNFWEMIQEVRDDELARRLSDIPKDITEEKLAPLLAEKFSDIARSMEKKYIKKIDNYLQENKEALRDISFPVEVMPWSRREKLDNFIKKLPDEKKFDENSESVNFIETTTKRFLNNKQTTLDIAKNRLTKAMPQFAMLNFEKVVDCACRNYILEEYEYFANLKNFSIFYNGSIPALNPILKDKNNNLHWHTYNFQQTKSLHDEQKSTSVLMHKETPSPISRKAPDESKLSGNRLTLFSPIKTVSERKEPSRTFLDRLSPRSSDRMQTFLERYLNNLSPTSKELADRKIEELSTMLSMG